MSTTTLIPQKIWTLPITFKCFASSEEEQIQWYELYIDRVSTFDSPDLIKFEGNPYEIDTTTPFDPAVKGKGIPHEPTEDDPPQIHKVVGEEDGLEESQTYFWQMRAVNIDRGEVQYGPWSEIWVFYITKYYGIYTEEEIIDMIETEGYIPIVSGEELNQSRVYADQVFGAGTPFENTYQSGLDKMYIQLDDIDLEYDTQDSGGMFYNAGKGWEPLGWWVNPSENNPYTGRYDGAGFTINGIYINRGDENDTGLFGYSDGMTARNLNITYGKVSCLNSGGLLLGRGMGVTIENVIVDGEVTANNNNAGCLVGSTGMTSSITSCNGRGSVDGNENIGGLVGGIFNNTNMTRCYSMCIVKGNEKVGGLVGSQTFNSFIIECYSYADVSGNTMVGGLVGFQNETGEAPICTIENSFAMGSVKGLSRCGGFIGRTGDAYLTDCYCAVMVYGEEHYGGFIGEAPELGFEGTIEHNYWDMTASGQPNSPGEGEDIIEGNTTSDMLTGVLSAEIYTNWDTNIWSFADYRYPYLKILGKDYINYPPPQNLSGIFNAGNMELGWEAPLDGIPEKYNVYKLFVDTDGIRTMEKVATIEHGDPLEHIEDVSEEGVYKFFVRATVSNIETTSSNVVDFEMIITTPMPTTTPVPTTTPEYVTPEPTTTPRPTTTPEPTTTPAPIENPATATYTLGDIPTTHNTSPTTSSNAEEPGEMTVIIPIGATIIAVDVEYDMTAAMFGFMSHQRSFLKCVSQGGVTESQVYAGVGNSVGTYHYNRTGLTIANNVIGGGVIEFELHAFRTESWYIEEDSNTINNKVDNETWTISVWFLEGGPSQPSLLTPENGVIHHSVATGLTWENGLGTDEVRVFLDTENPPLEIVYDDTAVESLDNNQIGGPLDAFTKYYWRVLGLNEEGGTPSFIRNFTTGFVEGYYYVGHGTETNDILDGPTPYSSWFQRNRQQYLILASELEDAGITEAGNISVIAFNVDVSYTYTFTSFMIKMRNTDAEELTEFITDGLTTVYGPNSYEAPEGWNEHDLTTSFYWDGESNLLIETSSNNASYTSNHRVYYTETPDRISSILYYSSDEYDYDNPYVYRSYEKRPNVVLKFDPE